MHIFQMETVAYIINSIPIIIVTKTALRHHLIYLFFCSKLATKEEIDQMVAQRGFCDNNNGNGVNYIGDRLHLEDMHPANVFIDTISETPVCIDCIVKFIRR